MQPAIMTEAPGSASSFDEKTSAIVDTTLVVPKPAHVRVVPAPSYPYEKSPAPSTAVSTYDSSTDVSFEKGGPVWEGYLEDELPEKTHGHFLRNVRFQIFSLYRRLFSIVFVVNMSIFIAACVRGGTNTDANYLGKVSIANLFVAILMRQAYVINAFFSVARLVPNT